MPKILGKFSPYDDANKLLDGRYLDGAITGSQISASGAITADSIYPNEDNAHDLGKGNARWKNILFSIKSEKEEFH